MSSVFISYSSKDKSVAKRIANDLLAVGIEVWLDEWEILVGDSITQRIQRGLDQVDFVAVILTQHSVNSGWVEKEWQSKIGEEAESRKVIVLPIKGGNCEIPLLLKDKKYADFHHSYEDALKHLITALKKHPKRIKFSESKTSFKQNRNKICSPLRSPIFYAHVPIKPNYFAGRIIEKNQLSNALSNKTPSIIVILGMAGQGKTTLAYKVLQEINPLSFKGGFWFAAYRGGYTFDRFLDATLLYLLGEDKYDPRKFFQSNQAVQAHCYQI